MWADSRIRSREKAANLPEASSVLSNSALNAGAKRRCSGVKTGGREEHDGESVAEPGGNLRSHVDHRVDHRVPHRKEAKLETARETAPESAAANDLRRGFLGVLPKKMPTQDWVRETRNIHHAMHHHPPRLSTLTNTPKVKIGGGVYGKL